MSKKQFWVMVASYYSKQLEDYVIELYAEDVKHILIDDLLKYFKIYRTEVKNIFMPTPAYFIDKHNPKLTDEDTARVLLPKIIKLIRSRGHDWQNGYYNPFPNKVWFSADGNKTFDSFTEVAIYEIGELGFKIITDYGWRALCDFYFESDEAIFSAQIREYIKSKQKVNLVENRNQLEAKNIGLLSNKSN